jgi:hypothetical protein
MRQFGHLGQVIQLSIHHGTAAYPPSEHGLIHDRPHAGRARAGEHVLALESQAYPAIDLLGRRGFVP